MKYALFTLLLLILVVALGCSPATVGNDGPAKKYPPIQHRDAAGHYR